MNRSRSKQPTLGQGRGRRADNNVRASVGASRYSVFRLRFRLDIKIVTTLLAVLVPCVASGDGGIIRLRQVRGAFSVTVFTSPEAARGGLADVSVLIQHRETGAVVLDAEVDLSLKPPKDPVIKQSDPLCGLPWMMAARHQPNVPLHPMTVRATREQASNKLLYAAPVELDAAGDWQMQVLVSRGAETASFDCLLPVALASNDFKGLWPFLTVVPMVIVAFAINQWLRRHSLEKRI